MAMHKKNIYQFQDVVRCNLCLEAAAQLHCDTCQVYVCHACVGTHITSDTSKQHLIVECKKRSKIKLTECKTHFSQICHLNCKHCNVPVCFKCVATTHAHHTVIDIFDFCKSKQEKIIRENTKIESIKMSELENANSALTKQIANLPKRYVRTKQKIVQHGKEWHKQVDIIVNNLTDSVDKMMFIDLETLVGHQQKLEDTISLLNQILQENTTILKSSDALAFEMYKSKVDEVTNVPLNFDVKVPQFLPIQFERENVTKCFGSLISGSVEADRNPSTAENMHLKWENDSLVLDNWNIGICEGKMKCGRSGSFRYCPVCQKYRRVFRHTCFLCFKSLLSCHNCMKNQYCRNKFYP